jgi:hypothetical protein
MPPKPPKSIEERVCLEFDRLSLGKMHEMGIQDRVKAIEGTLNSILGYEDKSTGCGIKSWIQRFSGSVVRRFGCSAVGSREC